MIPNFWHGKNARGLPILGSGRRNSSLEGSTGTRRIESLSGSTQRARAHVVKAAVLILFAAGCLLGQEGPSDSSRKETLTLTLREAVQRAIENSPEVAPRRFIQSARMRSFEPRRGSSILLFDWAAIFGGNRGRAVLFSKRRMGDSMSILPTDSSRFSSGFPGQA